MKDSYPIDFNDRPIETEYMAVEELELIKQLDPKYYNKIMKKKQREINKLKKAKKINDLNDIKDCLM